MILNNNNGLNINNLIQSETERISQKYNKDFFGLRRPNKDYWAW